MKHRILALLTILVLIASISQAQEKTAEKKQPRQGRGGKAVQLFDGKTLDGWTQLNGTATYKVEEETIVGRTTPGSPNSFLCSDKQFGDFTLEFEVKCDVGLNSGVQVRSLQKDDNKAIKTTETDKNKGNKFGRVFGPQVEIETSPGQAGYIYGEATSFGWLSEEPKSKDGKVSKHSLFKNDEWNKFRVVAKGNNIKTFINGEKVADLTHDEIFKTHPKGFIGLQVHAVGNRTEPLKVAWRNIKIREITPKE